MKRLPDRRIFGAEALAQKKTWLEDKTDGCTKYLVL